MKVSKRPPRFMDRTTPVDLIVALPGALRLCALAGTAMLGLFVYGEAAGTTRPGLWLAGAAVAWFGLTFPFDEGKRLSDRLRAAKAAKPARYRRDVILVQPEGEYVRLYHYSRDWSTPATESFHAETGADEAHTTMRRWLDGPEVTQPSIRGPRVGARSCRQVA